MIRRPRKQGLQYVYIVRGLNGDDEEIERRRETQTKSVTFQYSIFAPIPSCGPDRVQFLRDIWRNERTRMREMGAYWRCGRWDMYVTCTTCCGERGYRVGEGDPARMHSNEQPSRAAVRVNTIICRKHRKQHSREKNGISSWFDGVFQRAVRYKS